MILIIDGFKENFNYRFGLPRSDTCRNKLKDVTVDDSERQKLENEKTLHQNKAATFFSDLKGRTNLQKNQR